MKITYPMKIFPAYNLSERIRFNIKISGKRESEFVKLKKYQEVLDKFLIMTPFALIQLKTDWRLRGMLNSDLKKQGRISETTEKEMEKRGLQLESLFENEERIVLYGLRGRSEQEENLFKIMLADLNANPQIEDAILVAGAFGIDISLGDGIKINKGQALNLFLALNPNEFPLLSILKNQGIKDIVIVKNTLCYRMGGGIIIIPENKLIGSDAAYNLAKDLTELFLEKLFSRKIP